jgi:hypothetical protein
VTEVPIYKGGEVVACALVDDGDLALVEVSRWTLHPKGYATGGRGALMHRLIMGLAKGMPRRIVVDHINGDKLDNRRSNLRVCTQGQNLQNRQGPARPNAASAYRGVSRDAHDRWRATVVIDQRQKYLGSYETELEAAAVAAAWRHEHMTHSQEDPAMLALATTIVRPLSNFKCGPTS